MAVAATTAADVPREPRRLYRFLVHYPRIAAGFAISISSVILLAWIANIRAITYPLWEVTIMVANTALMAWLSGISLWLVARARRVRRARVVARMSALVVLLIALATLFEYATGVDLGIDRVFPTGQVGDAWPAGRPATYTALGFGSLAAGLLIVDRRTIRGRFPSDGFALLACAIAVITLLGYLFGVPSLYGTEVLRHIGMTLPAALLMLVLAIGLLTVHIDRGVLSIVVARDAGGLIARELLAGLALFPPIVIVLILGARLGWYALPFASALVLFFALTEGSVFILAIARQMSRIDAANHRVVDELRASEARLRSLVDQAKDGIFLADTEGRYIDVNEAGATMLGYTRDEILGMSIPDVLAPHERPKFAAERARIIAGKTTRNEFDLQRRDGSVVPVEVVASLLSDGRWQAIARDVTERKELRNRLRNIVDQMPDGVVVVDERERVQVINRAMKALAFDGNIPGGDTWRNPAMFDVRDMQGELLPFDQIPLVRAVRSGQALVDEELQLRQKDGRMVQIEARAAPLVDESGKPSGAVVVVHDISERKEFERLRDEWIAVIAHDLRQPLTALHVSVDMLLENLAPAHEKTILEGIGKATNRLTRMVDDLLDDARISARRLTVDRGDVDVVPVVARAVGQARLANPDVAFEIDGPASCIASIDQQRIEQVLGNLLSNAVKYRDPGTPIRVEVVWTEEGVRVGVFNEGEPIDQAELSQLFTRFYRTKTARRGIKPGIGLGLYMCKGLVEAHGGRIWVESKDGWTRFYFTLPAADQPRA